MSANNDEYREQLMRLGGYMSIMRCDNAAIARVDFKCDLTHIPYRSTLEPSRNSVSMAANYSQDIMGYEDATLKVSPDVAIKMRVPIIDVAGDLLVIGKDLLQKAKITHFLRPETSTPELGKLVMDLSPSLLWIPVFSSREMLEEDLNAGPRSISLDPVSFKRDLAVKSALRAQEIIFSPEDNQRGGLNAQAEQSELQLVISQPEYLRAYNCATISDNNRESPWSTPHGGHIYQYVQVNIQKRNPQGNSNNPRNAGDLQGTLDIEDPTKIVKKGLLTNRWRWLNAKPLAQRDVAIIVIVVLIVAFAWREVMWRQRDSVKQSTIESLQAALEKIQGQQERYRQ